MVGTLDVDVAVIGAGTAGLRAFQTARRHTERVVLIEQGAYGTTCARVGCMPSKLLLAAAEAAHQAGGAWRFGADVKRRPEVDGAAVMARVRAERDRFVSFVLRDVAEIPEAQRVRGTAQFVGDRALRVGEQLISTRATVIATGSRPKLLPFLSALGDLVSVNDDVFEWSTLPAAVLVFGPGVIGLELGQALSRLGVRVVVLGRGGFVGPLSDPAVRDVAAAVIGEELPLFPDAQDTVVERVGDRVRARWRDGDRQYDETFDRVIAAIGREPVLDRLDLHTTGATLDARGRPSFDPNTMQIGDLPLFIAGDANDDRPLLHEAADEGGIAGRNAARFPQVTPGPRRTPLSVVFSDPNLGMVGRRFAELDLDRVVIGEVSFEDQGRSRVMGMNRGLLRLYVDRASRALIGAELAAPRGEHLAHLLAWSVQRGDTVDQLLAMPFYHPVVEEGLRTALRDAAVKLGKA